MNIHHLCEQHHQLAQALFPGHATWSSEYTRSPPSTNRQTALRTVSPLSSGTFWAETSQQASQGVQTWLEQEMDHTAFLLSWWKKLMKLRQLFRQTSMLDRSPLEHPDSVLPFLPSARQVTSRMLRMAQESYCELISSVRGVREVHTTSMKKHLYSSPALNLLHACTGVFSSTFANFESTCSCMSSFIWPEAGEGTFMNTPESTTADNAAGLVSKELTQFYHRKVPKPPADDPVIKTFSAEGRSQLSVSHLRCDLTLSAPRKQISVSLQRQALLVDPWCRAPSQQLKMTLVHAANLFLAGSVERYPCPSTVSARFLLDPQSVLLRWQQLSSTSDRLVPSQYPPPTKQIRNLFFSAPWWKQTAGEDPSRHFALGSVL